METHQAAGQGPLVPIAPGIDGLGNRAYGGRVHLHFGRGGLGVGGRDSPDLGDGLHNFSLHSAHYGGLTSCPRLSKEVRMVQ